MISENGRAQRPDPTDSLRAWLLETLVSFAGTRFTLAAAVLELCRVVAFRPVADFAGRFLPLYAYGLGWIMPAALGFAVGMVLKKMR